MPAKTKIHWLRVGGLDPNPHSLVACGRSANEGGESAPVDVVADKREDVTCRLCLAAGDRVVARNMVSA